MNKGLIKEILHILIAIVLGIFVVKFVIWLIPAILIGICSYQIYKSMKKEKKQKTKTHDKKNIKIIDMIDEN